MPTRLPVKLRKTPGGFVIQCGPDKRAMLYLYVETDEARVEKRHLVQADAEELAKDVARALRRVWVIDNKHEG